jgi:hypothetical protein
MTWKTYKVSYPFDMIRTIARGFYIRPTRYSHSGFDWTPENDKWGKLSESERQPWYDHAIVWLETWKERSPQLHQYYLDHWIADLDSEGYNNLRSVRSIAF